MSTAMQGPSAFDALLAQCRDLASEQLDQVIAGMLDKADEALSELAVKTQSRESQKLYLEARDLARSKRADFAKLFHTRFLAEFQQRTNKGKKTDGSFSDADFSFLELSLVTDDDLDETLEFNELAAKIRRICEDEINALDQRVGVLLGDADLDSDESPLSAQAICNAYKNTCRQLIESIELREIFLKLFDDHVLDAIRPVYKAVNDLLVQNSILPKIRYGARRNDKKPRKKKGKDGVETEEDEDSAQDMFAALQKLMASAAAGGGQGAPGSGTGVGGGPVLEGAALIGSLTKLQLDGLAALGAGATLPDGGGGVTGTTNALHELKSSAMGSSLGQMDAMTLDIVAQLFDQIFDDPNIPLGAKGLIGRLQILMLKVAISDKELFSKKTHPTRQLLDTLAEIAIRLPADFNTESKLFAQLESVLQELISGYQEDVAVFHTAREQLIALMAQEDQRIKDESSAAAERVLQEEALAVAKSYAQEEVRVRVQANPLPGAVLEFLIEQWLKLLILIHVRRGTTSDAWKNAIETMDQLIWSVQPKDSSEERRKLAAAVPPLLKRVAAGLKAAEVEDDIRGRFFGELMKLHTKYLAAKPAGAPPVAPAANTPPATLDFTSSITVKNPFGGGQVQVSALDLDAEEGSAPALRDAADPDAIKTGDWFEWKEAGSDEHWPVCLIFVTPRKTRYIFRDRSEKDYIECTRNEVVRRLRTGETVLMEEEPEVPFFERIMGGVVSKMRGGSARA